MSAASLLDVRGVSRDFVLPGGAFGGRSVHRAVRDVSLTLEKGKVLGIVGESGCGKTTLSKLILGILLPSSGEIRLNGAYLNSFSPKQRARLIQPIFQDPYSSLNPRRHVHGLIRQPLDVHRVGTPAEREAAVKAMADVVGLPERTLHAYPNQLSGGQRQRVAIARALILRPSIVVCDEPTSALDVSVQAQIINLLMALRREFALSFIFVSHNLLVVRHLSDSIAVMKDGVVVEHGPSEEVFSRPKDAYTKDLLSSVLPS